MCLYISTVGFSLDYSCKHNVLWQFYVANECAMFVLNGFISDNIVFYVVVTDLETMKRLFHLYNLYVSCFFANNAIWTTVHACTAMATEIT